MTKPKARDAKYLKWLVKSRFDNQQSSVNLLYIMEENHAAAESPVGRTLVAISFSLWRAAFLANRTGRTAAKSVHATEFLVKMLGDNAIGYPQETASNEWTFNYYLDNAVLRLEELAEDYKKLPELRPKKGNRTTEPRWEYAQRAFDAAVGAFAKEMGVELR